MRDRRSGESVSGEQGGFAATNRAVTANETSNAGQHDTREGDVIQGLRSGLIFSLAIWAMLLAVAALIFA
jgi:hypothetical protein